MAKKKNIWLSVIIPAYNEEKRIGNTLKRISSFLDKKKFSYEILVVNDGSSDKTLDVACRFKNVKVISYDKNRGKGYAVRKGMLAARGDLLLFSDADLSTPIEELDRFLRFIDAYDIVIASRALKGANIKLRQPFYREFIGKLFNALVQLLVLRGIKDTQCGFKLFTRSAAKKIFSKQCINGFGFDVEVLYLARKYNLKIKELPVTWVNSADSKVRLVRDAIRMLRDMLQIKLNDMWGKYN
ncbi:MAG: glycosyltransferase family 2 protein [Candidatus Woesearchaeota archaeon]